MQNETIKDNFHKKVALVLGLTGQDGSYLAEFLLAKGYEVHGMIRPSSQSTRERIDHIFPEGEREKYLHYGDMTDIFSLLRILKKVQPDEVYNLAAQSHVAISWDIPYYTAQTTGVGVLNLLESIRFLELKCKIYNASTSELFNGKSTTAYNETSTKDPISPYGTAKLYGFQIAKNYREAFNMFICNGILFNHESPRRGDNFVTKKITNAIRDRKEVHLGNLDASRDWGYAPEYVEGMWLMLQQDIPDDYVLATGETHTVKEFIEWCEEEEGVKLNVIQDPKYKRPHDVEVLLGQANKAFVRFGWEAKTKGKDLVKKML